MPVIGAGERGWQEQRPLVGCDRAHSRDWAIVCGDSIEPQAAGENTEGRVLALRVGGSLAGR